MAKNHRTNHNNNHNNHLINLNVIHQKHDHTLQIILVNEQNIFLITKNHSIVLDEINKKDTLNQTIKIVNLKKPNLFTIILNKV